MNSPSVSHPNILDGKKTAKEIRREVALGCAALQASHGVVPGLTVVLVGKDPASQIYVRNKERAARKAGMNSDIVRLPAESTEQQVLETVRTLNADPGVHGILVQLPLPVAVGDRSVLETRPSLWPACTLNQDSGLIRKVRSAAPRVLSALPSSLELAVRPSRTWSLNQ